MLFRKKPKFKYSAFVSYRHMPRDSQWAKWIIESLSNFQTPPDLVQAGVPSGIGELFRDDKEMSTQPDMAGYLKEALWQSEHLLVVCSQDTPASDWVRAEISLFKHWGRSDKIHALLIDPDPASAFPAELRQWRLAGKGKDTIMELSEPAAASVAPSQDKSEKELKAIARDKLAAAILDCDLGRLRTSLRSFQRIHRTYQYFEHMVFRRGVPEGVGEVPKDSVSKRNSTLCFESHNGRVVEVTHVNGHGGRIADDDNFAGWSITYRDDGSLDSIDLSDVSGRLVQRQNFNRDATTVDFANSSGTAQAQGLSASTAFQFGHDTASDQRRSNIIRHLIEYDQWGFEAKKQYVIDLFNTPGADPEGNFGESYERDARGLPIATWYLGPDGERQTQKSGIASVRRDYDSHGRLTSLIYLDETDCLIPHADGFASIGLIYDVNGNLVELSYSDVKGHSIQSKKGFAVEARRYDPRGNVLQRDYLDAAREPAINREGFARSVSEFDDNGKLARRVYYGVDGQPVLHNDGNAGFTLTYDQRGNVSEQAYFGLDGKPILNNNGLARYEPVYDIRGNLTRSAFFGVNGEPVCNKNGFASFTQAFDASGNVTDVAYFGLQGEPVLHKDGYARFSIGYDARGNRLEETLYGVDGEPTFGKYGFARLLCGYDARGNLTERKFFGPDGEAALHTDGFSRFVQVFDGRGNPVEVAYYGPDGEPTLHRDGYARVALTYDVRGNRTEVSYYGVDGEPTLSRNGYARFTARFDEHGNLIEEACFGIDGEPVLQPNGMSRFEAEYDSKGNLLRNAYFGVDGKPTLSQEGIAVVTFGYDAAGNRARYAYLGCDAAPILNNDGVAGIEIDFDDRGLQTELRYTGLDGEPILHRQGFAKCTYRYDAAGRKIEQHYFGVDGAPVLDQNDGIAGWTMAYDLRGNISEWRYFGVDGQPCLNHKGAARITANYDAFGNTTEVWHYDLEDRLTMLPDGYAGLNWAFDVNGYLSEVACFGVDREPILSSKGYHLRKEDHDAVGRLISATYFDEAGAASTRNNLISDDEHITDLYGLHRDLILGALLPEDEITNITYEQFHRVTNDYGPRGHLQLRRFVDIEGKPAIGPNGFSDEFVEADPLGRALGFRPRRADGIGLPIDVVLSHDAYGRPTEIAFLSEDGDLVNGANGVARATLAYHDLGGLDSIDYWDADGDPVEAEAPLDEAPALDE
ncbi:MAG: TIR domain-containing protein, partial [Pseudomonadota bacterium]